MSPVTLKSKREEDPDPLAADELDEVGYDAEEEVEAEEVAEEAPIVSGTMVRQSAISDSRRRRLKARGIDPDAAPTSVVESVAAPMIAPKGRPTPSAREGARGAEAPRGIRRIFARIEEYFRNVRAEMNRVTWLPRADLLRLSYIVLGVTAITAAFLGIVSFVFESLNVDIANRSTILGPIVIIGLILIVSILWLVRDRLFPNLE